jgi:hypothetical protein
MATVDIRGRFYHPGFSAYEGLQISRYSPIIC